MRYVGADFSVGTVTHRGALSAIKEGSQLQPIYDDEKQKVIPVPQTGVILAVRNWLKN